MYLCWKWEVILFDLSIFGIPPKAVRIPLRFLSLILHYIHAEEAEPLKSLMTLLIIDWLWVRHMRRIPLYSNQYHYGRKDTWKSTIYLWYSVHHFRRAYDVWFVWPSWGTWFEEHIWLVWNKWFVSQNWVKCNTFLEYIWFVWNTCRLLQVSLGVYTRF